MSEATATRGPLNGVDTPTLFAAIDAVDNQRELAAFRFRAENTWQSGTHSRTSITSFYGAGGEHEHVREFTVDADHPQVLVGADNAPLPVELILAAIASCLTGGIGNISAAPGDAPAGAGAPAARESAAGAGAAAARESAPGAVGSTPGLGP